MGRGGDSQVWVFGDENIAAFNERVQEMIAAVCAEEFVARPSYMGCRGAIMWICVRWGRGAGSENY